MKSAYELAMERLGATEAPEKKLTDEQRKELADIEAKFRARIAEREVLLNREILKARQEGNRQELDALETQLRNERLRIQEEMDAAKEKARKQFQA